LCSNRPMPKRGNPRWSQGLGAAPDPPAPSEFERVAARLKLTPDEYANSPKLRAWAEKFWRQKFVPERLLKAWRLSDWGPPDD
jgi:hypothetical protein